MKSGYLSKYFEAVAVKTLKAVETNTSSSNQHEFNGTRELKKVIRTTETFQFPTKFIWMGEENEGIVAEATVSWYDSRKNQPHRSSEFRLYFQSNEVMKLAKEGDTMFIGRRTDNSLLIVIATSNSTIERQLCWLFNLDPPQGNLFALSEFDNGVSPEITFAGRFILEEIGIEIEEPENDLLDRLLGKYIGSFPPTFEFSSYCRSTIPELVSVSDDPDHALINFMNWEEKMFRRLERHNIAMRIKQGFAGEGEEDVEGFISFSLSVQNRRKARAGNAFEDHIKYIFDQLGIIYSKGKSTENKAKPDFLFPHYNLYHNKDFPSEYLTMLGVKTSLKDRWRQVLSEAERIPVKHLLTLEPGISDSQTSEMRAKNLHLVLPKEIHQTFSPDQQKWILSVREFITFVIKKQNIAFKAGFTVVE
jgi:hypothetical protein